MSEQTVDGQTVDGQAVDGQTVAEPGGEPAPRPGWGLRNRLIADPEAGMSTAEYAVGTVAACAFAAVLYKVVTGGSVVTALTGLVSDALATLS